MQKTTAKVTYFPCLDEYLVDFYGFRTGEMREKLTDIKNKRYDKYNSIYQQNETDIAYLRDVIKLNYEQKQAIDKARPFYRFWYSKAEEAKIFEIDRMLSNLESKLTKLIRENDEVKRKELSFCGYEARLEIEILLRQNGFALTQVYREIQIWTLEE